MQIKMQDLKAKILDYISRYGPCLPVQISKQIQSNILFSGAVLSELVANQKIKISTAKVGGSPVYYAKGQEAKLSMLYPHLHEREKKAYDILKENKIVYDKALEPWQRVALRDLKDFAHPVHYNDELFWRWYLFSEEESLKIIQESFKQNVVQENVKEEVKIEIKQPEIKQEVKLLEVQQEIKIPEKLELNEVQTKIEPVEVMQKEEIKNELTDKKTKIRKPKKIKKENEDFYNLLNSHLYTNNIKKIEEIIVKKNKEYNIIGEVNSDVGLVRFFINVKDKKKINDSDLSLAHNKAQLKKLPLMFLSSGELDKKAKEYIKNNYLIFEKI